MLISEDAEIETYIQVLPKFMVHTLQGDRTQLDKYKSLYNPWSELFLEGASQQMK